VKKPIAATTLKYLSVVLLSAVVFLPLYWIFINSFKTTPELTSATPTFFPRTFTLEHYRNLFIQVGFWRYFLNSTYVALASTLITVVLGSLAAYSIYRCRYPAREALFALFLSIYVFPRVLLLIPLFVIFSRLNLVDTLAALVILNVTTTAPFSVWTLRAFFTTVPLELEEAALVDGANRVQVLFRIFFPVVAPGIAALALSSFLLSWTEYLFASAFIMSNELKTIPVGMGLFLDQYFIDWGLLMSSSVIVAIPPIILFALVGRYYVKGLSAGAVKG
jgi:ABC-type glycerol-3-phosphate transport system permease component